MKSELIVALDVPTPAEIRPILDALPAGVTWFKVGLELYTAAGPAALEPLHKAGKNIFLDLKLHDIPNTVARAVTTAARHGVRLLTVHASGGRAMLQAAAEAARALGAQAPQLLAVTTLTSLGESDLREIGVTRPLAEHTLELGRMAVAAGIDGLVCSVHEAGLFRRELGRAPLLVTPGIRPADAGVQDQKRVATPTAAVAAGANYLVVGRPILAAPNPAQAAEAILAEMAAAEGGASAASPD